jgi:hypothetical protein
MSRTLRHVIGAVVGVLIIPLVVAAFGYPSYRHSADFSPQLFGHGRPFVAAAALILIGIVLGLSAGSRLSPLASLIPGLVLTGFGAIWVLQPSWVVHRTFRGVPDQFNAAYQAQASSGVLLVLGVLLLVASTWPSRWRGPSPSEPGDEPDEYVPVVDADREIA